MLYEFRTQVNGYLALLKLLDGTRSPAVEFEEQEFTEKETRPPDPVQHLAEAELRLFFEAHSERVFSSRQIELIHEGKYFHWITNRAIRSLEDQQFLASEAAGLKFGGRVKLIWKRSYRFYRREAKRVVDLISEYSFPAVAEALGLQGEFMVLEAFARNRFELLGKNTAQHGGVAWGQSEHDLDLIVQKDGIAYGVEVKNTLPYLRQEDFEKKREICAHLGLRPVFAVRMMPKTWIFDLQKDGGYALILKYQHYPWGHKDLARRVAAELELPVICANSIGQG